MKEALKFSVVGEDDQVYEVSIERDTHDTGNLQAKCSCGESRNGGFCHHRFEVLEGETANLVSENLEALQTLRSWIKGSDIEVAMQNLSKAKTELILAHEKLDKCRKALVQRMLD